MLNWWANIAHACRQRVVIALLVIAMSASTTTTQGAEFDILIRNGTIYDGSGQPPVHGDIGIIKDRIALIGSADNYRAKKEIDAAGLAVAPGFINMLSWANESLIADGRSQSDIRQGVTLEVMGEGVSLGPLTPEMQQLQLERQSDITYDITWTTLEQGLQHLAASGVSPNVASF